MIAPRAITAIALVSAAVVLAHPVSSTHLGKYRSQTPIEYDLLPESRFDVRTDKAGWLGAFGHRHRIRATQFEGVVVHDPDNASRSRVEIVVATDGLTVVREGKDIEDGDEVEAEMRASVLPPDVYPTIAFRSRIVTRTESGVQIVGTLEIAGRTRPVAVDVALVTRGDTLRARGGFEVRQTEFGIEPYSAFGGSVKVADEIAFEFDAVALARR